MKATVIGGKRGRAADHKRKIAPSKKMPLVDDEKAKVVDLTIPLNIPRRLKP